MEHNLQTFVFGKSVNQVPIMGYTFNNSGPKILVVGGVHGNEWEGVSAAKGIVASLLENNPFKLNITIIPEFNIDGVIRCQRKNANEIDLNRNLPTNDWTSEVHKEKYNPGTSPNSEPENKAFVDWINKNSDTAFIYTLHSWEPILNTNGNCDKVVEPIAKATGYKVSPSIGYPTPGCMGTYTGLEKNIPTLTYEIQRDIEPSLIQSLHVPAILKSLEVCQDIYS